MSVSVCRYSKNGDGSAEFSGDGRYRYRLMRRWSTGDVVTWILLNPSTADENKLDPTLRRCTTYSREWGYGGMEIVNIFGFRSTDPHKLLEVDDPNGPDNDSRIMLACTGAGLVVAGWGCHPLVKQTGRDRQVLDLLRPRVIYSLHTTKEGFPSHPLYLPKNLKLVPYKGRR